MRIYMIEKIKKNVVPLSLALLAMTTTTAVQAAHLTINDSVEGQVTLSHSPDWEFGVTSNGTSFSPYQGGATTVAGESGSFSGTWYSTTGQTGSGTVYIVEPGTDVISDKIEGTWNSVIQFGFDKSSISITVTSSACGDNLGTLPAGYSGVDEPQGSVGITGSFLDAGGSPVSIPSNLGMTFTSIVDSDCDGVVDVADYCPSTVIPEDTVPSSGELGINRYALTDDDSVFDTVSPGGTGSDRTYTIQDTGGCSCEQIIDVLGLGNGQTKKGCSNSNMEYWINEMLP